MAPTHNREEVHMRATPRTVRWVFNATSPAAQQITERSTKAQPNMGTPYATVFSHSRT